MRITPFILIGIGIFGLIYPENMLDIGKGGGRWVFIVIIALGLFGLWRLLKKRNDNNDF